MSHSLIDSTSLSLSWTAKRNGVLTRHTHVCVCICEFSLRQIFRDHGNRKDRQKARLLWLIEEWGLDRFRDAVLEEMCTNGKFGVGAGGDLPVDTHQHHAGESPLPMHASLTLLTRAHGA